MLNHCKQQRFVAKYTFAATNINATTTSEAATAMTLYNIPLSQFYVIPAGNKHPPINTTMTMRRLESTSPSKTKTTPINAVSFSLSFGHHHRIPKIKNQFCKPNIVMKTRPSEFVANVAPF